MASFIPGFMGSKFVRFIRYNLVYFVFISFIFLAYFYMFDISFHTKYKIEDLKKTKDNGKCYITNNDLADNSRPTEDTDPDETNEYEDFVNSKNRDNGNYNTYNTVYEFNDVIVYRFKKVFHNISGTKLFSPPGISITMFYNMLSDSRKQINMEDYYILEKKLRI